MMRCSVKNLFTRFHDSSRLLRSSHHAVRCSPVTPRQPLLAFAEGSERCNVGKLAGSRLGEVWKRDYATANGGQLAVSVIAKRVDPAFTNELHEWQRRMNKLVSEQPGFLSVQHELSEDDTLQVVIISFKEQDDLVTWLASEARYEMLREAEAFHNVNSVQQLDTTAWGMAVGAAKPAPPMWKNILVVFSALYPTVVFTNTIIEPCFSMLPYWSALLTEAQQLVLVGITCTIMNVFTMKAAFSVIGPTFFPPESYVRTGVKIGGLLTWAALILAVQIPWLREAVFHGCERRSNALTAKNS